MAVIIATFCHAQTKFHVKKCIYMEYINQDWVEKKTTNPDNLNISLDKNVVRIDNRAKSTFVTDESTYQRDEKDNFIFHTWEAIDQDGYKCTVMLIEAKYVGLNNQIIIHYPSISSAFKYILE